MLLYSSMEEGCLKKALLLSAMFSPLWIRVHSWNAPVESIVFSDMQYDSAIQEVSVCHVLPCACRPAEVKLDFAGKMNISVS